MKSSRIPHARLLASLLTIALLASGLAGCGGAAASDKNSPTPAPGPQLTGARVIYSITATNAITSIDLQGPGGVQSTHSATVQPGQEVFLPLAPGNYTATFWIYFGGGFSIMDFTPRHFFVNQNQVTVVNYP